MEQVERERIRSEYRRRETTFIDDRYARSNPTETFIREERVAVACKQLHATGKFPQQASACLEIGCGKSGWLPELRDWGVDEQSLFGVDLSGDRLREAHLKFPRSTLALADARCLPWRRETFDLVILSTVLSSVLDPTLRTRICQEAARVLTPEGALLVYDFRVDNPKNRNVRRVRVSELREQLSPLQGLVEKVTLAPPLLRRLVPQRADVARLLTRIPLLRTHFVACFTEPDGS